MVDQEFQKASLLFLFGRGHADLWDFAEEVEEWLPVLDVIDLPVLDGDILSDVAWKKSMTAGGLDGWGWRDLKAPASCRPTAKVLLAAVSEDMTRYFRGVNGPSSTPSDDGSKNTTTTRGGAGERFQPDRQVLLLA